MVILHQDVNFSPLLSLLQVLAASKNKISTLKGFPHLPLLEVSILCIARICIAHLLIVQ